MRRADLLGDRQFLDFLDFLDLLDLLDFLDMWVRCFLQEAAHQGAWSGWLKEVAPLNILDIKYKLDTFHLLSGWLKVYASQNIPVIFLTLDTFQLLSGWLKEVAPLNILHMSVTLEMLVAQNSLGPV